MAMSDTDKFMDKFDPVNSNREKRKKMRLNHGGGPDAGGGRGGSKRDRYIIQSSIVKITHHDLIVYLGKQELFLMIKVFYFTMELMYVIV